MDRSNPRPGEFYLHFKGNLYQIITIAAHSETREQLVVYQALYPPYGVCARPLAMFLSPVDRVKYPDAAQEMRFVKVDPQKIRENASQSSSTSVPYAGGTIGRTEGAAGSTSYVGLPDSEPESEPKNKKGSSPEDLFLLFLDEDRYGRKLELLSALRGKLTRTMLEGIAASMDVVLPGKSMEDDLDLIEDHIRTRVRFEGGRMRG